MSGPTRSKVDDALDRADRLLEAARKKRPNSEHPPQSEWDMDTARHEIEELQKAVAARPPMPTPVQVVVQAMPEKPRSDPPVSGGLALTKSGVKIGKLPPVAVVAIVLGLAVVAAVAYVLTH